MFSVNHIFLVYKSDSGGKGCPGSLSQTRALVLGLQTLLSIPVLGVRFCGIAQQWQLACATPFSLFLIWVMINQGKFWSQHLNPFKSILLHLKSISQTVSLHKWLKSKGNTYIKDWHTWASLVAQWLRIRLPMQGTRVRALVREDPTCRGAARPVSHNYWACASGACAPQQERLW